MIHDVAPKASGTLSETAMSRPRLVIVDDHPGYARGLQKLFESDHPSIAVVGAASNPLVALEMVARDKPDLILLDLRMPGMSGVTLAERVREVSPLSRVVMLTVSEEPQDVRDAFRAGAVGYLSKDLEPEALLAAVELVLLGVVVVTSPAFNALTGAVKAVPGLSPQELRLLQLAAEGVQLNDIATDLIVSRATATRLMAALQRKLGVSNRDQLVAHAARQGWVYPRSTISTDSKNTGNRGRTA
jgi:DNA-binding NarL/FixJ family response regulator